MTADQEQRAEQFLKSINDAATAVGTRFVRLATVGAYVAVTVASTTHEMLLRGTNQVPLPFLNVPVPITGAFGFYTVAPWLIVLLHSDLLLQLSMLTAELARFDQEAKRLPREDRGWLRQRIKNVYYMLYLSGEAPSRFLYALSAFVTWVTAVAIPLALLLSIQIRFLPSHNTTATWLHRAALITDVVMVASIFLPHLWRRLGSSSGGGWPATILRRVISVPGFAVVACAVTLVVSLAVATLPDEQRGGTPWLAQGLDLSELVFTANQLGAAQINGLRDYGPSPQLRELLFQVAPSTALQGRDLRYARLYNAILPKVDLRAVRGESSTAPPPADCAARRGCQDPPECEMPGLQRAQLAGANLQWAAMQLAMLNEAILEDADLAWARLQWGSLFAARMNRANLVHARLQGVQLDSAKLCGANLNEAELHDATFRYAHLQGATLRGAQLSGAKLEGADLRGADLSGADLTNAVLRGAQLQGAVFGEAPRITGTVFAEANLDLTDLPSSVPARSEVDTYLAALACADPSVAHGLSMQALNSPARDREGLARILLDAQTRPECHGMASLPQAVTDDLAKAARVNGKQSPSNQ
jgi:uncharacterized protein YjbI with pentapeptide repeats